MSFELLPTTNAGERFVRIAEQHAADCAQRAEQHDRDGSFPFENFMDMQKSGFMAAPVPAEYGGLGVESLLDLMVGMSRLGRGDGSTAIAANMHTAGAAVVVRMMRRAEAGGDGKLVPFLQGLLRKVGAGEVVMCFPTTEAGTDLMSPNTEAVAGLTAAYELREAGNRVTVLEARNRPGGRVHTLRDFKDGLYAEAGAVWILNNHEHVLNYLKLFDVAVDAFVPADVDVFYHVKGMSLPAMQVHKSLDSLGLRADEGAMGLGKLFARYLGPALQRVEGVDSIHRLDEFDQVTLADFLRRQGASEDAITLLKLGTADTLGDGADEISAAYFLRDVALARGKTVTYAVRGGSDLLPQAFASRLKDDIIFGAAVRKIQQNGKGVLITIERDGTRAVVEADYTICALPFSVLKTIIVDPPFSPVKQKAIDELPYTSVTRTYLQTRKRYWKTHGLPKVVLTDLPIKSVRDATMNQPGDRGILESFIAGHEARKVAAMTNEERLKHLVSQTETLFPGIREHLEAQTQFSWDGEPWSLGAYMWFRPGQLASLVDTAASPEGRVYFAGDHTSFWPAWMQGAVQSGTRVALEVSRARSQIVPEVNFNSKVHHLVRSTVGEIVGVLVTEQYFLVLSKRGVAR
jgi:monoamine oxidase